MTFEQLRDMVRDLGGDARLHTFDAGQRLYIIGLGLEFSGDSPMTKYWDEPGSIVDDMAKVLGRRGVAGRDALSEGL